MFKVGNDVIVEADDAEALPEERGHWKASITSFFSMQLNGKAMLFFTGRYYNQCIVGDENTNQLFIDKSTGMSVLDGTLAPFDYDCIRPIYSLLHKFIPLPLPKTKKIIAYEVKDLKQRDGLLSEGCCGNVPLWLESHDIVRVCLSFEGRSTFMYAVVRETHWENKVAKLAILTREGSQRGIWKVKKEENLWRS